MKSSTPRRTAVIVAIAAVAAGAVLLVARPWNWGSGESTMEAEIQAKAQAIEDQVGGAQNVPEPPAPRSAPTSRRAQPVGN